MNKIKDIIYDKSDILIAILILALAAILILWRLGIILEYPREIIGTDDPSNVLTEPEEQGESGESGENGDATEQGETGDASEQGESGEATEEQGESGESESQSGESGEAGETGDQTEEQGEAGEADDQIEEEGESGDSDEKVTTQAQWDGNKLSKDLEVTITGTTASAAVQCLIDAGVYEDYAEYQKICKENGWDHEKMRAGVFTFEKGTSKKEITREVNWS